MTWGDKRGFNLWDDECSIEEKPPRIQAAPRMPHDTVQPSSTKDLSARNQ
jgi:hypothetical protein